MVLDTESELRHNFDAALIDLLIESAAAPALTLLDTVAPDGETVTVRH